jgi:uncharacterized protein YueI
MSDRYKEYRGTVSSFSAPSPIGRPAEFYSFELFIEGDGAGVQPIHVVFYVNCALPQSAAMAAIVAVAYATQMELVVRCNDAIDQERIVSFLQLSKPPNRQDDDCKNKKRD